QLVPGGVRLAVRRPSLSRLLEQEAGHPRRAGLDRHFHHDRDHHPLHAQWLGAIRRWLSRDGRKCTLPDEGCGASGPLELSAETGCRSRPSREITQTGNPSHGRRNHLRRPFRFQHGHRIATKSGPRRSPRRRDIMPNHMLKKILPALLLAATASAATAQETQTNPATTEKGAFSILFENDIFYNSDHDYSNGVQFAYTTAPNDTPEWMVDTARALPFFNQSGDVRARYALGQDIFTPHNLSLADPPLTDRPYAGFLYGAVGLVDDTGTNLDQLQMTLGVVGPDSLGEETQKWVHAIFNDRKPMGWATQLHDEPGLIIEYNRSLKLIAPVSF